MSLSGTVRTSEAPGVRLGQIGELVRPTVRAIRWAPLLGAVAVAFVQVFVQTRETCPPITPCLGPEARVLALRISAVILALGAAFVLDDPTEETFAHVPTPRWVRRAVRVGLAAPVVGLAWMLLVPLALRSSVDPGPFPRGALTLELAALVTAALALAAASARFVPEGLGGVAAGPILLGLVAAGHYLPNRLAVFVIDPTNPRWHAAHDVWRALLVIAIAGLVVASRDPWRPGLRWRAAPRSP